ncbi:hypothetical protein [Salinibacter ruber]|uniref:Uncharacterized protein n=1 Tax=Salinibacter ruber TaxID=146919 RepID=A0A9X2UM21_9BACT|nr:hypothetical protein [Salinibacter ruber]MBB4090716.1 hypothetical protein [Salinibacter ruber]MCS3615971.1 hypothetical protein [Salinibacter ruber]MCS4037155.1 hypothetical protein [Salinibacter ruber]
MALSVEFALELLDNGLQSAIFGPPAKSVIDRFPGAVALGKVPPGRSRAEYSKDSVHNLPVILVGPASSVDFRKSLFNPFKLLVGQFVAATSGHG